MTSPPHQHNAATTPALRGPTRSSQPPHIAAADPSSTKNSVYIMPRLETRQSQVVVKSSPSSVISGHATLLSRPTERDSGSQNTLKPYAIPMQRWMQRAAGGTSQRLNPAFAMMRSRSSNPGPDAKLRSACSSVVIRSSQGSHEPFFINYTSQFARCPASCRAALSTFPPRMDPEPSAATSQTTDLPFDPAVSPVFRFGQAGP